MSNFDYVCPECGSCFLKKPVGTSCPDCGAPIAEIIVVAGPISEPHPEPEPELTPEPEPDE